MSSSQQTKTSGLPGSLAAGLTVEEAGALAHPTRRGVAEALGAATEGLTVAQIADRVSLHPNAVRQHLEVLQRAGVVVAAPSAPTGRRGRPSTLYALAAPHAVAAVGHRELVRLLLELVRRTRLGDDDVEAFGWEQGGRIIPEDSRPETLTASIAGLGFAPEEVTPEGDRRRVHEAPPAVPLGRDLLGCETEASDRGGESVSGRESSGMILPPCSQPNASTSSSPRRVRRTSSSNSRTSSR